MWELLEFARDTLKPYNVEILPEIHEHYTTLDTHDGIGVVDVKDLLSEEEIDQTKKYLFSRGANVKQIYNTAAYNNLDIYQLNCTYYSALGNNDHAYLLARAIQFFTHGIPQVYYVGLLAGENDIQLLEETKVGRNINRRYYTLEEAEEMIERPVVIELFELMRFRNSYPVFDSQFSSVAVGDNGIKLTWESDIYKTVLECNLKTHDFQIRYWNPETEQEVVLNLQ